MTRYRHWLKRGESKRINGSRVGTHEFNISTVSPHRHAFWETSRNRPSSRRGSNGHDVVVSVKAPSGVRYTCNGRVSGRRRKKGTLPRKETELRFRPMSAPDALTVYAGQVWPANSIVIVTKSKRAGVDYDYEVVPPTDKRWKKLRLRPDERERYG